MIKQDEMHILSTSFSLTFSTDVGPVGTFKED